VLVVPPFGEEMNKSRHLLAATTQRLCEAGVASFLPDLFGTGDSEGEFRDARVHLWLEDLEATCRHAEALGRPVRAILAVRLGCALAVAAARRGALPAVSASAWWQPVLDGKRFLQQFLRLRVAAAGMRGGTQETVESLRTRSAAGETLEVAGYELSPALVQGLEALAVDALPAQAGDLHWFELVREEGAAPPLPVTRFADRARAAGAHVALATLASEPFWGSTELVRSPRLAELTAAALGPEPSAASNRPVADNRVNA
jgi:exosortase A-associated hydrolase 2